MRAQWILVAPDFSLSSMILAEAFAKEVNGKWVYEREATPPEPPRDFEWRWFEPMDKKGKSDDTTSD